MRKPDYNNKLNTFHDIMLAQAWLEVKMVKEEQELRRCAADVGRHTTMVIIREGLLYLLGHKLFGSRYGIIRSAVEAGLRGMQWFRQRKADSPSKDGK